MNYNRNTFVCTNPLHIHVIGTTHTAIQRNYEPLIKNFRPILKKIHQRRNQFVKKFQSLSSPGKCFWGNVFGCVAGYLTRKVAKTVCIAMGGGILLMLYADHKGYIRIYWEKINREMQSFDETEMEIHGEKEDWTDKVRELALANPWVALGFVGGFPVGLHSTQSF